MAQYNYDEGGNMAAYFALSFLVLILLPMSFSFLPNRKSFSKAKVPVCPCPECEAQRAKIKKETRRTIFNPKIGKKAIFVTIGWAAVAALCYKVVNADNDTKLYDPFEILGIRVGAAEKEIKRHFKKLSIKFHPDKVQPSDNQTVDEISAKFVEITKAYKSLVDPVIRENLAKWGHPDGRQETTMGIAIPKSMIEGKNGIWVLGLYAILLGGSLPFIVGRWWFGHRSITKDGVHAKSAEMFFKDIREDSKIEEITKVLAVAWPFESASSKKIGAVQELEKLEREMEGSVDSKGWISKSDGPLVRRATVLLYAHLLRIPVQDSFLRNEQRNMLTHAPILLTSLLNITLSRNWLNTSLHVMHLNAYLVQAIKPSTLPVNNLLQYPGIRAEELPVLSADAAKWDAEKSRLTYVVERLKRQNDARAEAVSKAGERWGRLEIVDVYFKVIGERIITPGAYVNLVMKLRISPPMAQASASPPPPQHDKKETEFLVSRKEAEDLPPSSLGSGFAHAPYWPTGKRPQWWAVLSDDKTGKVIVAPIKLAEVPFGDNKKEKDWRTWKIVFQAPNQVGLFTWRIRFVSDTFLGEEPVRDMPLKLEDPSLLETNAPKEDEISDPEEDTLAGQMAAMRGHKVKKVFEKDDESDDSSSSGTDDDDSDSSSSSDSD